MFREPSLDVGGNAGVIGIIATMHDIDAVFSVCHEYQLRTTRLLDGGYFSSLFEGRIGRGSKLPPQFGQIPERTPPTQSLQKVHSIAI